MDIIAQAENNIFSDLFVVLDIYSLVCQLKAKNQMNIF